MGKHFVAERSELPDGEHVVIELEGRDVGVYNVDGTYYAYTSWCPHHGGPLCEGKVSGTTEAEFDRETLRTSREWTKDGEIVICPWHHWQFDLTTGRGVHDEDQRLPAHDVEVEGDEIYVVF